MKMRNISHALVLASCVHWAQVMPMMANSMQARPRPNECERYRQSSSVQTVNEQQGLTSPNRHDGPNAFTLCLHGDEHCHYLADQNGFVVTQDDDDRLVYAQKAASAGRPTGASASDSTIKSMLAPSDLSVENDIDLNEYGDMLVNSNDVLEMCSKRMQYFIKQQHRSPGSTGFDTGAGAGAGAGRTAVIYPTGKFVGSWRNLVIPVRFSDHRTRILPTRQDIEDLFNHPNSGSSVQDWSLANSYGRFHLHSVVTDWVDLDHRESYYITADAYLDYGKMEELVTEALNKLEQQEQFDFDAAGKEHSDGDYIGVTLLHSGYGGEFNDLDCQTGALPTRRVWSHQWHLAWASTRYPNVRLEEYAITSSMFGACGSELQHLIAVVHEQSHVIGLKDMIGSGSSGGSGVGAWDVMGDAWGWNGRADRGQLSAYSKAQLGWVEPTILEASGQYSIRPSASHSNIYRIDAGFPSKSEYLLIESRQPIKQDADLDRGGLAIWHVDETRHFVDPDQYPGHEDYPEAHGRVVLLQADGKYDLQKKSTTGDSGDLYRLGQEIGPGQSQSIWSSDAGPYPNTDSYLNGQVKQTGVQIYDISGPGEEMRFSFITSVEEAVQLNPGNLSETPQLSSLPCDLDVRVSCHIQNTDIKCENASIQVAQEQLDPVCVGVADIALYIFNKGDIDKLISEATLFVGGRVQTTTANFTLQAGAELVLETNLGVNFCEKNRSYSSSGRVMMNKGSNSGEDAEACVVGASTVFETGIIGCVNSDQFYEGGFGDCLTYARGGFNEKFCSVDRDVLGNFAMHVCQECGKCKNTNGKVKCHLTGMQFDAGYGSCDTYSVGAENHKFCDLDEDFFIDPQGVLAKEVCEECGQCTKTKII